MSETDLAFLLRDEEAGRALPALIIGVTPEPPHRRFSVDDPVYPEILRRRIARRVLVDENGCWEWQGSINYKGYGQMGAFRKKSVAAHRVSYAVFCDEEPIPVGYSIDHLCRNRACVRPDHLEAVPHGENVRRGNTGITWRRRTHCEHGHEFTPENTQIRQGKEGRACRTCRRAASARSRAAHLEERRLKDRLYKRKLADESGRPEKWPGRKHPGSAE